MSSASQIDHDRAKILGDALRATGYVRSVLPVATNIVIFELVDDFDGQQYLEHLQRQGVLALDLDERTIRFVLHLDISDSQIDDVLRAIADFGA